MRHKRTQTQVECTCSSKSGGDADVVTTDIIVDDDDEEFDSEFDEEDDEAILKAMLLAQEYYLLYGDEGNITSCAKVEHDLMFRQEDSELELVDLQSILQPFSGHCLKTSFLYSYLFLRSLASFSRTSSRKRPQIASRRRAGRPRRTAAARPSSRPPRVSEARPKAAAPGQLLMDS